MKIKLPFITVLMILSFSISFANEPISIDKIPSRIKLFETINFNFKVDNNEVTEYRYRLRVPGDWMGGIKFLSDSWSDWENSQGRNISFNNFNVEGNYKFEIEYKTLNSKRVKKLDRKFKAYWEYPEIRLNAFNISSSIYEIKNDKHRYKALADEYYEAYKMWDKKYRYEFNRLQLTTSPEEILNKLGVVLSEKYAWKLTENLAGTAAEKWLEKVFAPKLLYDLVKEGSVTIALILRSRAANEAALMTVLTNHLYLKCMEKSY